MLSLPVDQCLTDHLLSILPQVNVPPSSFPIQFSCRWTKGSTEDKARVDYQYTSGRNTVRCHSTPSARGNFDSSCGGCSGEGSNGAVRCMVSVSRSEPQCVTTSVVGAQYSPTVEDHPTCTEVFGDVTSTVSQNTAIVYNSSL